MHSRKNRPQEAQRDSRTFWKKPKFLAVFLFLDPDPLPISAIAAGMFMCIILPHLSLSLYLLFV